MSLEFKSRRLLLTAGIQSMSFVLIFFHGLNNPSGPEWDTFFWLMVLFSSIAGLSRSFLLNKSGLNVYLFQLIRPNVFYLLRCISNFVYIFFLSLFTLLLLWLFYGFMPFAWLDIILILLISSLGFSAIFTFSGAIASESNQASVLLPLLSIPLLIPIIMVLFALCNKIIANQSGVDSYTLDLMLLLLLDVLYFLPGMFLFKHMWGE